MRLLRSEARHSGKRARWTAAKAAIPGLLLALILFPSTLALSGTPGGGRSGAAPADECGYFAAVLGEGAGLA